MISRRAFLRNIGIVGSLSLGHVSGALRPNRQIDRKPNILLLYVDQFRFNAMGHAGDPVAHTPVLDRLASEGVYYSATYCQNPVCVPSRTSLLTGRYSHSTGIQTNQAPANRDLTSLTQVLRAAGMKTACFGKLHIIGRDDLDWDVLNPRQDWPPRKVERPGVKPLHPSRLQGGSQPLGQPSPFNLESHKEWKAKEETIKFMRENQQGSWFVQCSFTKPHPAFEPPQRYWDLVDRSRLQIPEYPADDLDDIHPSKWKSVEARNLDQLSKEDILDAMQGYYGSIAFCDALFGEVLAELDDLNLRERTIIIFTSDHGEMLYDHRLWTKSVFFEQAVRVPMIISWPEGVPKGIRSEALIEQIDIFPTLMDLLSLETPKSVQGRSFARLLKGETAEHRSTVYSENQESVMRRDARFKFILHLDRTCPELYDLKEDPKEVRNLAQDDRYRKQVSEWTDELLKWRSLDEVSLQRRSPKRAGRRKQKK